MECNICGNRDFVEFKTRGKIRCTGCGSIERTRLLALYLDKYAGLRPGLRVLHFAPERALFKKIAKTVGDTYDPCDLDVERYAKLTAGNVRVRGFNLCTDLHTLPDDHYDLILHNHVMEHLPCNVTAVLWHLHRALKPGGLHMFSIPIIGKHYEESFADMSPEEREKRFAHAEHMRNFAMADLPSTLGMLFDIEDELKRAPRDHFDEETLRRFNVPENRWKKFNGASMFMLGKEHLKLRPGAKGRLGRWLAPRRSG